MKCKIKKPVSNDRLFYDWFSLVGVGRLHPVSANILMSVFYEEQFQRVHYLVLICFEYGYGFLMNSDFYANV